MRLMGAGLVALAGLWSGLVSRSALRRNAVRCAGLCRMLELLSYELQRFRTPLPELFSALSRSVDGDAAALCRSAAETYSGGGGFSECWRKGVDALPAAERDILTPLGEILGRYGAEEQAAAVDGALHRMEDLRKARERAFRERGRVQVGLGAGLGLMLAVMLL